MVLLLGREGVGGRGRYYKGTVGGLVGRDKEGIRNEGEGQRRGERGLGRLVRMVF